MGTGYLDHANPSPDAAVGGLDEVGSFDDASIEELLANIEGSLPDSGQVWEDLFQCITSEIGANGQDVDSGLEDLEVPIHFYPEA